MREPGQPLVALTVANARRRAVKEWRERVAMMPRSQAIEAVRCLLLDGDPQTVLGCPVERVLSAIPRVGVVRVEAMLRYAAVVSGAKPVGLLSMRQRRALSEALDLAPSQLHAAVPLRAPLEEEIAAAAEALRPWLRPDAPAIEAARDALTAAAFGEVERG